MQADKFGQIGPKFVHIDDIDKVGSTIARRGSKLAEVGGGLVVEMSFAFPANCSRHRTRLWKQVFGLQNVRVGALPGGISNAPFSPTPGRNARARASIDGVVHMQHGAADPGGVEHHGVLGGAGLADAVEEVPDSQRSDLPEEADEFRVQQALACGSVCAPCTLTR